MDLNGILVGTFVAGFLTFLAGKLNAWIWAQYQDWWDYKHRVFNVDGNLSTPDFCGWDNCIGGVDPVRINKCVFWGSAAKRGWYITIIDESGPVPVGRNKKISFSRWRATKHERSHLAQPLSGVDVAHMRECLDN